MILGFRVECYCHEEREQKQLSVIMDGHVKDDSMVQQRNYRQDSCFSKNMCGVQVCQTPVGVLEARLGALSTRGTRPP